MDTDLSLIEMSGENDSLLQQILNDGDEGCSVYSSISFSPLCATRPAKPSPLGSMGAEGFERPGSSSCRESINKENVNSNKPEMPKLSLEPQQMKRKKKGGGYNLRKSLAWDRAFFTEEGVLDQAELSMISGHSNSLGEKKLSVINEEGSESLLEIAEQKKDSTNLLALQEKIFKDLPVKATSGSKKAISPSSRKPDGLTKINGPVASPVSWQAKRRVLSTQDVNRSGSKRSGCPRPVSSSSPATVNTTIGAAKELKVIRMPVPKLEPASASSSAKSSIHGGPVKCAQPTRSVIAPKIVKVRSSFSCTKAVASSAISGPGSKSSTAKSALPQAKRNVGKVAPKLSSSRHIKIASEGLQDKRNPPVPQSNHVLDDHNGESIKMGLVLPQKYEKPDNYVPNVPTQTAKPSGLRMPSPSMGFFHQQPKTSAASENSVNKYRHPSSIPYPTSAISRNPSSMKNVHDIRPPQCHDREQLINDWRSGYSSKGLPAMTGHSTVSHGKAESSAGLYITQNTDLKSLNGLTDEISSNQQNMHISPRDGEQGAGCVPCDLDKQLPLDNKLSDVSEAGDEDVDRNVDDSEGKLSKKSSPLSMEPSEHPIIDEENKLSSISSEERDVVVDRRMDSQQNPHVDIVLQTEDVSKSHQEEPFILSSGTRSAFFPHNQSANARFSNNQDTSAWMNPKESSNELQKCGTAENADSVSNCKENSASEAERSCGLSRCKSQENTEDSAGSQDGSRKLLADAAENPFQDENLPITGPKESDEFVASSEGIRRNFTEELQKLGCQNTDHSMSSPMQPVLGSQDLYTDAHVRNDVQFHNTANDLDEELLLMVNEDQSMAAITTTDSDNSHACLSDITFSKTKMEEDHSFALLLSTAKDEDGPGIGDFTRHEDLGDFTRHEDLEDNQYHPLVQNVCQHILSPTSGTDKLCFDETSIEYAKGEPKSDNRGMPTVRPRKVDIEVMEADISQTPLEGEHAGVEEREIDGATSMQVEAMQHNPSSDISFLSNSAAKNESLVSSDLVEQSREHPDPQHCPVEDAPLLGPGVFVEHNSSDEHHEKSFDNTGCESKLTNCILILEAEPDPHGAFDVVDAKAEIHDLEDLLSDSVAHEDSGSDFYATLEADASIGVTERSIAEAQTAADGNETCHASDLDHLKSSNSHVEVDLPLDHSNSDAEPEHHSESSVHFTKDSDGKLPQEGCENNRKQNSLLIKPPPNVPPFSDEWLAAIEAAGEEILTMKSGAVQNSPPDKTAPEPGPWSPVKKHNQAIGPYDCTKFTNTTNIPDPGSQ